MTLPRTNEDDFVLLVLRDSERLKRKLIVEVSLSVGISLDYASPLAETFLLRIFSRDDVPGVVWQLFNQGGLTPEVRFALVGAGSLTLAGTLHLTEGAAIRKEWRGRQLYASVLQLLSLKIGTVCSNLYPKRMSSRAEKSWTRAGGSLQMVNDVERYCLDHSCWQAKSSASGDGVGLSREG